MSSNTSEDGMSAGAAALASATSDTEPAPSDQPNPGPEESSPNRDQRDGTEDTPEDVSEGPKENAESSSSDDEVQPPAPGEIGRPEDTITRFDALIEADVLQDAFGNGNLWAEEGNAFVTNEGLEFAAIDPANVGLVQTSVSEAAFETFDVDPGRMGLRLNRLVDVVSMADPEDVVSFTLNAESQKLHIEFGDLEYTMALLDPATIRSVEDPDREGHIDYESEIQLVGSALRRGIKGAAVISEYITFEIDADSRTFIMEAMSETETSSEEIHEDDPEAVEYSEVADISAKFALEYIKDVGKRIPAQADVNAQLSTGLPIRIVFTTATGVRTKYLVAPRLSES